MALSRKFLAALGIEAEKVDEIIKEIVNASSVREAASNVAALEGVNKSAGMILADILGE